MDIKTIRLENGLTQEKLAHLLGVTVATINRWEMGRHEPSPMAKKIIESWLEDQEKRREE
jgi:putative transcriptional regulator